MDINEREENKNLEEYKEKIILNWNRKVKED